MIEYATYHASQKRGKAILKQQFKERKTERQHCSKRAEEPETVSLALAKARTMLAALQQ